MRRRDVLKHGAVAAGLLGLPAVAARGRAETPRLPEAGLLDRDPDAYWLRVRKEQFLLPDWRVFLNTGGLGVAPRRVLDTIMDRVEDWHRRGIPKEVLTVDQPADGASPATQPAAGDGSSIHAVPSRSRRAGPVKSLLTPSAASGAR